MTRKILVLTHCDACLHENRETDGEEIDLGIDSAPKRIALCAEHRLSLIAPLDVLLQEYGYAPEANGAKPTGAKRGPKPRMDNPDGEVWKCPECGNTLGYRKSMVAHVHNVHGIDHEAIYERWPHMAPRDRRTMTPQDCPECGRRIGSRAGLSAHVRAAHPEAWLARGRVTA